MELRTVKGTGYLFRKVACPFFIPPRMANFFCDLIQWEAYVGATHASP